MTVLVTTDWHLNSKPRDRYRHEWVRGQLPALIRERSVDILLMLGDLTDDFDNHPASLVNDIMDHLVALRDARDRAGTALFIMRGNHDYVDAGTPFFKFVSTTSAITWINAPSVRTLPVLGRTLFLPHTRDHKADWADVDFSKADICFAHNTFDGTISESGAALSGVPPSAIPDDLPVYSGDIHKRQKVGHITYVGAPYTIDFGDNYKPRVMLFTKDKTVSIPCQGTQKRLIESGLNGHVHEWLKDAGDDIVKLRVTVGPVEAQNWADIKRGILADAAKLGVRMHSVEPVMHKDVVTAKQRYKAGTKAKRDDQIVEAYCRDRGVDDSLIDTGLAIVRGTRGD